MTTWVYLNASGWIFSLNTNQLLCIWSCFCAPSFRQKASKDLVNYKNLVKVQLWNISCLDPFLFFLRCISDIPVYVYMCVNKLLINAFPNSHRKTFQQVTWALRLYHSRESGWLYSSTNWLLALLSNWIHRPTEEWDLNLPAGQDRLSLHLPSVPLLRAGDEGTCPEDCCQWAAPLGAGSLDSRAVARILPAASSACPSAFWSVSRTRKQLRNMAEQQQV